MNDSSEKKKSFPLKRFLVNVKISVDNLDLLTLIKVALYIR